MFSHNYVELSTTPASTEFHKILWKRTNSEARLKIPCSAENCGPYR